MASSKLAVLDSLVSPYYVGRILPLMLKLGSERIDFYCSLAFVEKYPAHIQQIKHAGIKIITDDYDSAFRTHDYFLGDSAWKGQSIVKTNKFYVPEQAIQWQRFKQINPRAKFIWVRYVSGHMFDQSAFDGNDLVLLPSDIMLLNFIKAGKFIVDNHGLVEIGKSPNETEAVVGGLFHVSEETLQLKKRARAELKFELSDKLKVKFDMSLPLAVFMVNHFDDVPAADRGLARLAQRANVLIKVFPGNDNPKNENSERYSRAANPNIFYTDDESVSFLMRYAADANLLHFYSGGFTTSVMLGMRTIPVHTQRLKAQIPPEFFNYNFLLRNTGGLSIRIMHNLGPLNIESTDMLLDRINDEAYWERYEKEIPLVQSAHFGNYYIGDQAVDRCVFYIKRVLEHGSFAPQSLKDHRVLPGPATLNSNCRVML